MAKRVQRIEDLTPDEENANQGTERGRGMLEESLRRNGAGRSVLADREGRLIAGNKTAEVAGELGLRVREVHTTGDELVVVVRDDLDLSEAGGRARELAYADNRVGQVSLSWSLDRIVEDVAAGVDLRALWTDGEVNTILNMANDVEASYAEDGTGFAPNLAPETSTDLVTDEQVARADTKLQEQFQGAAVSRQVAITCPGCAETFFVNRDDLV